MRTEKWLGRRELWGGVESIAVGSGERCGGKYGGTKGWSRWRSERRKRWLGVGLSVRVRF